MLTTLHGKYGTLFIIAHSTGSWDDMRTGVYMLLFATLLDITKSYERLIIVLN